FGVAKSADLKHWQAVGDVSLDVPKLTNVWAPEWFRDRDGSVYVVVSLSTGGTKGPFAAYALRATDVAKGRFDAPKAMTGLSGNYIDTFVVNADGRYTAFTKNETSKNIELATADRLLGPWTLSKSGDWAGWGSWIEGPAVVPVTGEGKNAGKSGWRIYFDDYLSKHYYYSDSFDAFKTWTPRQELGGVSGAVRHFTVIPQPTDTIETVMKPKKAGKTITWDKHSLIIDGKREMIWAAEFHPFRLPSPSLWRDILQKMKATGYNTVNYYIDWGYQTSRPNQYDFSGIRDMERAIEMAEEEGLYIIIRPGPYVNAELTMGGFPGYLARQQAIARTDDPEYLKSTDEWSTQLNAIVKRHQITDGGGNVIAYQIENELGQTTDTHKRYMQHLVDKAKADGITVPLFHNSASRLPNWTPPGSTAWFALEGPKGMDLYAFDGYPGGGCTNTHDPGKPNKVPNWGLYADVPKGTVRDEKNPLKIGAPASPETPGFVAEIGGGWFDFWGSVGSYDCTAKRTGPQYERAFYGSSLINGLSLHSVYMGFGGTSWGWLPASVVYTSYDYGSPISEARVLRDKSYTMKQLGQFVQAATPLLASMDKGAVLTPTSPNIKLYHNTSPEHGDVIFAIHEPSDGHTNDAFGFDLTTGAGTYHIKTQLNGYDVKMLVANYPLERQRVVYTTSDLQTQLQQGARDIALFYGRKGEAGETVLRYAKSPKVEVLSGKATSVYDQKTGDLRLNYVHDGLTEVRISDGGVTPLTLLLADDATAQQFWQQKTSAGVVLEQSKALIREAALDGTALHLTGDTTEDSPITIYADNIKTVTFNGQPLGFKSDKGKLVTAAVAGPDKIVLPDLMQANWQGRMGSPEADTKFDDSAWRKTDLKVSAATIDTQPPPGQPVLAMSDYGFHHGDVWYRGRFTVTEGTTPDQLKIRFNGGPAGVMQVWLDGQFIGEHEGTSGEARPKTTMEAGFTLPKSALTAGEHVLSIMVRNMSHNWDLGADDEHKEARGLISVSLSPDANKPFATPIDWKIQGNKGGEDIADLVRGPMNNGGLFGEREGWYLPVDPKSASKNDGWAAMTPTAAPPSPGTYWLRAQVPLDLPKGHDIQLGLQFGDIDLGKTSHRTRVLIFVNGWHVGNFIGHVGPQRIFILPPGILNPNGDNTLTLAVTTDGAPENALEAVKLVNLHAARGGVPLQMVSQPTHVQR
ncbi:MAG: beta-galactosidase, partial [Asticcacaulis sp.]